MKAYSFYFNTSDWLASPAVKMMSKAERGVYIGLLASAWENPVQGTLPASEDKVRRLAEMSLDEWAESGETLLEKFPLSECGTYRYNARLQLEVAKEQRKSVKATEYTSRKAEAGSKGGRVRAEREAAAKVKGTHTKDEWSKLLILCDSQCVICGSQEHLQKDHITPIYQGGSDGIDNLQPLCRSCNTSKGPENTDHRRAYFQAKPKQCLNEFQALLANSSSRNQAIQEQVQEPTNVGGRGAAADLLALQAEKAKREQTVAAHTDPDYLQGVDESPLSKPGAFAVIMQATGYPNLDIERYRLQIAAKSEGVRRTSSQWRSRIIEFVNNDYNAGKLLTYPVQTPNDIPSNWPAGQPYVLAPVSMGIPNISSMLKPEYQIK